jgi:hypothetical protein
MAGMGWWRSHRAWDLVELNRIHKETARPTLEQWAFISTGGGVRLSQMVWIPEVPADFFEDQELSPGRDRSIAWYALRPLRQYPSEREFPSQRLSRAGFALAIKPAGDWTRDEGGLVFSIALPYWFLCLLAVPLPLTWVVRRIHRRQRMTGNACVVCGYDLRATPDRCPECGAVARVQSGGG